MSQVNGTGSSSRVYTASPGAAGAQQSGSPMSPQELEIWLKKKVNDMWEEVTQSTAGVEANTKAADALGLANTAALKEPPELDQVAQHLRDAYNALPDTPQNKERREEILSQINRLQPDPAEAKEKKDVASEAYLSSRTDNKTDIDLAAFRDKLEKSGKFTKGEIDHMVKVASDMNNTKDSNDDDNARDTLKKVMDQTIGGMFPEGGKLDKDAFKTFAETMKSGLDSDNRLAMVYLQQAMSDAQEAVQTVSNIKKNASEANQAIIRNFV